MKIHKNLALIFFLVFALPAYADNHFSVLDWKENVNLISSGKTSEVLIQGKVVGLPSNQIMTSFSIIFDNQRNIKITKVICDNKSAEYSFLNNALTIKFPQGKLNNGTSVVYFSYEEKYDKISQYLRQEAISIPDFAAGANAKVVINFPGYLESATLNPNITKNANSFTYNNVVPKNGVQEIIKLTPASSVWDVVVRVKIDADKPLNDVTILLPTYFQNGGQKVENFIATSNLQATKQGEDNGKKTFKFSTSQKTILIQNKARISTGKNNRIAISRNPNDYLKVSAEESALLAPILAQIKQNPNYQNLPLHAQIGKFVNGFIRYDLSYVNKLPEVKEILRNPVGVCTEYSKLYNALARIAGIPAMMIDGAACGEYDECQGHAWNMVYYNNQWIDVDPTWDLMSGVVSSSHVYFSDDKKGEVEIQYLDDNKKTIDSKMDFEMKNAL